MNKQEMIISGLKVGKKIIIGVLIYTFIDQSLTYSSMRSKEKLSSAGAAAMEGKKKVGEIVSIMYTEKTILGLIGKPKLKCVGQYKVIDITEGQYTVEWVGTRPITKKERSVLKEYI